MGKKRLTYWGLLPLAALLAGCMADYEERPNATGGGLDGLVPIYMTASVLEAEADKGGAGTRAGADVQSSQLASGETFTVAFSGNTTVASTTYKANGSGGATCSGTQPYFTLAGTSTTVYAYYPEKPGSTFSVQADQSGDANYKKSDLMYATVASLAKTGTATTASLTFSHKMAKIIVKVTGVTGEAITKITDVRIIGGSRTINVTNTTTCTLGSTLTNANSTSSYVTMYTGGTGKAAFTCAALIPPQTINGAFLLVKTDVGDLTYSLTNKTFASGKSYTYSMAISYDVTGELTATIQDIGNVIINAWQ